MPNKIQNPLKSSSKNKEDTLGVGSKYSLLIRFRQLKKLKINQVNMPVGLPCQIRGLEVAGKYSWVKENCSYTGLCSRGVTYKGTEFVVDKFAGTRK